MAVAALMLGLFALTGTATAGQSPDPGPSLEDCQPDPAHYGEIPTCTYDGNGKLIDKSYDNDPFGSGPGDGGIPGWFIGIAVLGLLIGGGITLYRISMARDMATRAGLDPHDATAVALLSDDGLGATYLAASLAGGRHQTAQPAALTADPGHVVADLSGAAAPTESAPTPSRSTADRLRELEQLRDQKLISDAEYDARRKAIVESI